MPEDAIQEIEERLIVRHLPPVRTTSHQERILINIIDGNGLIIIRIMSSLMFRVVGES